MPGSCGKQAFKTIFGVLVYICRCVRRTCPLVFLCRALVASTVSTPVSRTRFRCRLCLCCVAAPVSGSAMAAAMGEAIRAVLQPLAMAEHEVDEAEAALLAEAPCLRLATYTSCACTEACIRVTMHVLCLSACVAAAFPSVGDGIVALRFHDTVSGGAHRLCLGRARRGRLPPATYS